MTSQGQSENSDQSGPLHPMLPNADLHSPPIFPWDGAAAILVCKSERDLGRVGRGAELGGGGKNRETVTASHCLVFEGRAETLSPRLIESTKKYTPQR